MEDKGTYHARASARPATPPAIRWVLSGIFSFGAGIVGDALAGLPSSADLIDMAELFSLVDNGSSEARNNEVDGGSYWSKWLAAFDDDGLVVSVLNKLYVGEVLRSVVD